MVRKIGIFCSYNENIIGGQTTKTIDLINEAKKRYDRMDVVNQKKKKGYIGLLFDVARLFKNNDSIILIVASSGYFRLLPFLALLNGLYRRDIYEITIGGIRHRYIEKRKWSIPIIRRFAEVYVESSYMAEQYRRLGLPNARYLGNYKTFEPLPERELEEELRLLDAGDTFKVCTFSRVDRHKGIDTAVKVCRMIHEQYGISNVVLDIYGPVDKEYEADFCALMEKQPEYISYRGVLDSHSALQTLKDYACMICPTKWRAEGFPGAFIDALAAGLPILATDKENFRDVVRDGVDGYLVAEGDMERYAKLLIELYRNRDRLAGMKRNALKEAGKYRTETVLGRMFGEIEERGRCVR